MDSTSPAVTALLREAAEWRLLGLLFEYPTGSWRAQVEALARDFDGGALPGLAAAALECASEGLHIALFGPGGRVPVREVTYRGGVQFGYLMAELAACYDAFGYSPSTEESSDHLAVEAGFVAYLKMKQAFALASDDGEHAAIASEAAETFVKEHLAILVEPVAGALEAYAPDYLIQAAAVLLRHAGPSPRSGYPLGADAGGDDSAEVTCGLSPADSSTSRHN